MTDQCLVYGGMDRLQIEALRRDNLLAKLDIAQQTVVLRWCLTDSQMNTEQILFRDHSTNLICSGQATV